MADPKASLIKELFLLDPQITFLNHGSFGACPRPVFEQYQAWQLELERQPVEFLGRRATILLAEARAKLADFLGVSYDEIVYFPNPTTAINMVARSLDLRPGDEILTTDHEYGAMDRTWRYICHKSGAKYIQHPIKLPVCDSSAFVDDFWGKVTPRTRAIFISHYTSPTALIFPVEQICHRARQAGIISIVDGAHVPGHLTLNLTRLEADIYTGACHKWLMAPKGSAFLYASRTVQPWLMPLVVSWGYESENPSHSQFIDYHEWQGTRDLAAFLSVPAAIKFHFDYDWESVRRQSHDLAVKTYQQIKHLTGLEPISPERDSTSDNPHLWFNQMFSARLPKDVDPLLLKLRLHDQYHIEVPVITWGDQIFIRVSIQGYNDSLDTDRLLSALGNLLLELKRQA